METFESKPNSTNNFREKDLYFLQLNTPRIILMSSALLGLIIASFLFGMNFVKDSSKQDSAVQSDIFTNETKSMDIFDSGIPPAPSDSDYLGSGTVLEKDAAKAGFVNETVTGGIKTSQPEIITSENLGNIVPEAIPEKKVTVVSVEKKPEKSAVSVKKKDSIKKENTVLAKRTEKKSKVVEVIARHPGEKKASAMKHSGFSIQVASYDSKGRAEDELKRLKQLDFRAYVTSSEVNGKQYHRVRIGPDESRERIMDVLASVQELDRYKSSYLIRE